MVTTLMIVGGDPALDLVNTVGDDRVPDPLDDYESFAAWAARIGAVDDATASRLSARGRRDAAAAGRALTAARDLRVALDHVFRPLAAGGAPPADALEQLAVRAGSAVERGRLVRDDGAFGVAWDGDHLERPLWPLEVAALDLLRSGPLDRLKGCEDCPWLFLDTSRNRSRRWCSMNVCGGAAKMRRYRARQATAGR